MKPLSLIHVVSVKGLGGTGTTAFRLARLMAERGHRVLFCAPAGSLWAERAAEARLDLSTEMGLRSGLRPGFFKDVSILRRLMSEREADVVHVHRSAEYWRSALAVGPAPRKTRLVRSRGVVVPLGAHLPNRWLHNRRTDMVICTAQVIHGHYRAARGFDMKKVRLLHDGVNIEEFQPYLDGSTLRADLGIAPEALVVAVVARLHEIKGHRYLLEAAPAIVERHPEVRFLLTGRAVREKLAAELKNRAAALGVARNFVFAGSLPNVPQVLAAANIFALCSVGSEGSSRGTMEAMAAGLPAVTTNVGCLPDLVVEGETGFLVPPRDSDRLAARLSELLADSALRGRMSAAARARAEAEFDERKVAERLEALYGELAGG